MTQLLLLDSKDDLFVCGRCKAVFTFLPLFMAHKTQNCTVENPSENKHMITESKEQNLTGTEVDGNVTNVAEKCAKPSKLGSIDTTNITPESKHCKSCQKSFNDAKSLIVHLKTHSGKPYQCQICGRCFSQSFHLQRHELTHKVWPACLTETTVKSKDVDALSYLCIYCDKYFNSYSQFRAHLKNHSSLKKYRCIQGDCISLFDSIDLLLNHVASNHSILIFKCHICDKAFKTLADIADHHQNHKESLKNSQELYKCAHCDACFKKKERLSLHLSLESHVKTCIHCNKTFSSDKRLRMHLQIHRNIKPFQCNICGKKFHMKKYLAAHKLMHGDRQYCCSVCNYKFKRSDLLQRHMKSHLNKNRMKCPFKDSLGCNMEFTRNDKLKLHMRHHTKMINMKSRKRKFNKDDVSTMEILIVPVTDKESVY